MVTSVTARPRRLSSGLPVLLLLATTALAPTACASPAPTPAVTAAPTPVVTPDPHLGDPATAKDVFNALGRAGLSITPNTATAGATNGDVVTKIFATYIGWPLDVVQYRTSAALAKATKKWAAGEAPGQGEAAIAIVGSNILVSWGPRARGVEPGKPDARQSEGLDKLVHALDVLLSPLRVRTTVPVDTAASVVATPALPATSPAP